MAGREIWRVEMRFEPQTGTVTFTRLLFLLVSALALTAQTSIHGTLRGRIILDQAVETSAGGGRWPTLAE